MASQRICAIDGCGKTVKGRGWCSAHYAMWQRHGNPTIRTIIEHGKPLKWLMQHVHYADDACLLWPFAANGNGYGQVRFQGRKGLPHRIMCMAAHGLAPTKSHQAAHACGNRACVNPRHLRWASQSENEADKVAHGRAVRGERHPAAKVTRDDVIVIRSLSGVVTHKEMSEIFGISEAQIGSIIQRRDSWLWL